MQQVKAYLTHKWQDAREDRLLLKKRLMSLLNVESEEEFIRSVGPETAVFTFLAGSNTRWIASFSDPEGLKVAKEYKLTDYDKNRPRGLVKVKNLLPDSIVSEDKIPLAFYNLWAVKGLGKQIVVYSSHWEEILKEVIEPLGLKGVVSRKQQIHDGKSSPLGHGDALVQIKDIFDKEKYKYLVTNFNGDVNSRETIVLSLMSLVAMDKLGEDVGLIISSAYMKEPKYPITLDEKGLPVGFGHAKLIGAHSVGTGPGPSNVGIRVYRVKDLLPILESFENQFQQKGTYSDWLGHERDECAQDDIDLVLASKKKVRHLCVAMEEEILSSVKRLNDIPGFLEMMKKVLKDNRIKVRSG